jgi:acyl carrier protein
MAPNVKSREEIREKAVKVLSRVFSRRGKELSLTEATTLGELNVNSAQMIDIVLDLEDEFGVDISESSMPKLHTVGEIVTIIHSLLNAPKKAAD